MRCPDLRLRPPPTRSPTPSNRNRRRREETHAPYAVDASATQVRILAFGDSDAGKDNELAITLVLSERTYADAATLFAALACVPSRKPFLKRRGMCLMWRMRPVPFVRLRSAFSDQLNRRILAPG